MSIQHSNARSDSSGDADARDVRAATEYMYVVPFGPAMYEVYSEAGEAYRVDLRLGGCTCPDAQYRGEDVTCKHERRVLMALGEREIPDCVGREDVDRLLAERPAVDLEFDGDEEGLLK